MSGEETALEGYQRYAIYYAPPPGSMLNRFGEAWMGRDAAGAPREREPVEGLPEPLEALTVDAARYGFHGTLKAPFPLAEGISAADLDAEIAAYAARTPPADGPGLAPMRNYGFVALRPMTEAPALEALAAGVVAHFARFGAKPDAATLAKRRRNGLSHRQEVYLAAYGYPYVLEEFRFHITLTKRLDPEPADAVIAALAAPLAPVLPRWFELEALCLFGDPGEGRPFRLLRRHPLRRHL